MNYSERESESWFNIFLSSSAPSVPSNAAPEIDLTHLTLKKDSLVALATPRS